MLLQVVMGRGNYAIRGERPAPVPDSEAVAWLLSRGVKQRAAELFLEQSGCETIADVAVFLRVQLAPLAYANVDSINSEMRELLGVNGANAFRIIKDIDVASAPGCSRCYLLCTVLRLLLQLTGTLLCEHL